MVICQVFGVCFFWGFSMLNLASAMRFRFKKIGGDIYNCWMVNHKIRGQW